MDPFGHERVTGPGRSDWVRDTLGDWYGRVRAEFSRGYHEWFDSSGGDLVEAARGGREATDALERFGVARAHAGYEEQDALDELTLLGDVLPERLRGSVTGPDAAGAVRAGFASVGPTSFPAARPFGDAADLDERLTAVFTGSRREGPDVAAAYAFLVVEAGSASGPEPSGRAVHTTASVLLDQFPSGERITWFGRGRFGTLVHRHPGLAFGVTTLERTLRGHADLEGVAIGVWLVPIPDGLDDLNAWRGAISKGADALPPPEARVENAKFSAMAALSGVLERRPGLRADALRRRVATAWRGGLSLVAGGTVVVLVAVAVADVLGPAGRGRGSPAPFGRVQDAALPPGGVTRTPGTLGLSDVPGLLFGLAPPLELVRSGPDSGSVPVAAPRPVVRVVPLDAGSKPRSEKTDMSPGEPRALAPAEPRWSKPEPSEGDEERRGRRRGRKHATSPVAGDESEVRHPSARWDADRDADWSDRRAERIRERREERRKRHGGRAERD